jgi:Uma2 family endonuclease
MIDSSLIQPEQLRPLRRKEYDQLVEMGVFAKERIELVYGLLVTMSPQKAPHAYPLRKLTRLLVSAIGDRAEVQVQSPLAVSEDSEPEPDLAVVPPGDYRTEHPTTAHLVVEVADSSLRSDRLIKGRLYAEVGIPEYWIIDVRELRVERYLEPRGSAYAEMTTHGAGERLTLSRFPDVSVLLDEILPLG